MSEASSKKDLPEPISALNRVPNDEYNFKHTVVQIAPVPARIVMWNLLDFAHVNYMHRKTYQHCKILAEKGNVHLIEYGVNQFFFLKLPISFCYLMWHEFIPPNTVRHLSRSPWGSYTKAEVVLDEFEQDGKTQTRITHSFQMRMSPLMGLMKKWIIRYLELWSKVLWDEDQSMLLRRKMVLESGFLDHPVDAELKAAEGFAKAGN